MEESKEEVQHNPASRMVLVRPSSSANTSTLYPALDIQHKNLQRPAHEEKSGIKNSAAEVSVNLMLPTLIQYGHRPETSSREEGNAAQAIKTEPEKMQEESETTEQNKDTSELINVDLSSDSILIDEDDDADEIPEDKILDYALYIDRSSEDPN